ALAQVSKGFAQDLANVLAAIRGHAALGALSNGLPPRVAESLEVIQLAAARGRALTQNMMALGTPAPIQRRVTGVVQALHETLRLLTPVIPAQISVQIVDRTEGNDRVVADPNLLQQVLLNLLLRARDAMPSGGTLSVSVDRVQREGPAADVRMRIADTGTCIPKADLPHVFDPFYVRPGDGVGTGLALALVRSFVDSCGGRIEVRSDPAAGTEFTLTLASADGVRGDAPAQRHLVVLGEGHPLLRPMLAEALQQSGYDVQAPETREAFLESVGQLSARNGAIVVDAAFVGLTPREAHHAIERVAGRPVTVIVASAVPDAGPSDGRLVVIAKPLDVDVLRMRLHEAIQAEARDGVRKPPPEPNGP
ncbi:MAG: hypothetical protein JNK53_01915, partial [Phycisphaerae bacterium]|nr:hypothetical protein [Phycisphaerae bacterium]